MKVQTNKTPSFDLVGLTLGELKLIRLALGRTKDDDDLEAGLTASQGMYLFERVVQAEDEATA